MAARWRTSFLSASRRWRTLRQEYQLEYGVDSVEMHEDALAAGEKVLIIDDLIATAARRWRR
ncbi:MAG: hypothetical protein ABL889_04475 [Terricaulis sp.]